MLAVTHHLLPLRGDLTPSLESVFSRGAGIFSTSAFPKSGFSKGGGG